MALVGNLGKTEADRGRDLDDLDRILSESMEEMREAQRERVSKKEEEMLGKREARWLEGMSEEKNNLREPDAAEKRLRREATCVPSPPPPASYHRESKSTDHQEETMTMEEEKAGEKTLKTERDKWLVNTLKFAAEHAEKQKMKKHKTAEQLEEEGKEEKRKKMKKRAEMLERLDPSWKQTYETVRKSMLQEIAKRFKRLGLPEIDPEDPELSPTELKHQMRRAEEEKKEKEEEEAEEEEERRRSAAAAKESSSSSSSKVRSLLELDSDSRHRPLKEILEEFGRDAFA